MHYALTRVVGTGRTEADAYRPPSAAPEFSVIDLRPDPAAADGWMLVATPERDRSLGVYLGDAAQTLSPALATALSARLGVTLDATPTLAELVAELLTTHARTDGTRWRPMAPRRGVSADGKPVDRWDVYLGGRIWSREVPALTGAAAFTESFDKANSSTLGPDLTWVEGDGAWNISANQAQALHTGSGTTPGYAYHSDLLSTSDLYAQATITYLETGNSLCGVCMRAGASSNFYAAGVRAAVGDRVLEKFVNGTLTVLSTITGPSINLPALVKGTTSGSAITGYAEGAAFATVTDTSLAGPQRGGLFSYSGAGVENRFDAFTAGDLQARLTLTGTAGPAGALVKQVPKMLVGSTVLSGAFTFMRVVVRLFTGDLRTTTGVTQYPVTNALTNGLVAASVGTALSGTLERFFTKGFDGSVATVGDLLRRPNKLHEGALAPTGTLARLPRRIFASTLGISGGLVPKAVGRIFGQPGVVAIAVRVTGEVRSRLRRG